ncbi:rRNA maturation RNase YbeY [Ancylothrix sp. C2]|uniref:rRNA maturation RNase YbeY n=1 Tax=Ancylothrix sp. D3o TaxID=2953691 RepID=UPI0021BB291C|nr:rRNA maturation RNase YbeY [Ancylothrix sp. D3o]MCT7952612.1 rRNA maturation RNase YbeY [Ancylothrix sp. D3o]
MADLMVPVEVDIQDLYAENKLLEGFATAQISLESWQNWIERWLEFLQEDLPPAPGYELSLRLTDDHEIQALNAQYRFQDKPTDVLAFAALEVEDFAPAPPEMPVYLGDIVISVDTATRQASERGHSLEFELAWLASHGLLHLLGWDHPDEDSLSEMLNQQALLLEMIGLISP